MSGEIVPRISVNQKPLVIANVEIYRDEFSRYNLNSLQRASEANGKKSKAPNKWLENKSTQELIEELKSQTPNSGCGVIEVVNGGERHGTYADERLAVAYAAWISPAFHLKVIQAFIDMKNGHVNMPEFFNPSTKAAIEALLRIDAMEARQAEQDQKLRQQQEQMLMIMQAQMYMGIREYVMFHGLTRQLPPGTAQQAYGRHLTGYCLERGIPVRKVQMEKFQENHYPVQVISETIFPWLSSRNGQLRIDIDEDGIWHNND